MSTVYQKMNTLLVSPYSTPIILVDWSDLDTRKQVSLRQPNSPLYEYNAFIVIEGIGIAVWVS